LFAIIDSANTIYLDIYGSCLYHHDLVLLNVPHNIYQYNVDRLLNNEVGWWLVPYT